MRNRKYSSARGLVFFCCLKKKKTKDKEGNNVVFNSPLFGKYRKLIPARRKKKSFLIFYPAGREKNAPHLTKYGGHFVYFKYLIFSNILTWHWSHLSPMTLARHSHWPVMMLHVFLSDPDGLQLHPKEKTK
jgi:hypothetical protein